MASSATAPFVASAGQVSTRGTRFWLPLLVAACAVTFAVGVATGFGLPRAAGAGMGSLASTVGDVAANTMSEAARQALYGPTTAVASPGVAGTDTSVAATDGAQYRYALLAEVAKAAERHDSRMVSGLLTQLRHLMDPGLPERDAGVAVNNMSDAARRAVDAVSSQAGVAVNNMSDARWRALHGRFRHGTR